MFEEEKVMGKRQYIINHNEHKHKDGFGSERTQRIISIECLKPVTGEPYSFAGALACERCIRRYCRENGYANSVELELRERTMEAKRIIKDHLQRPRR
jgi:hypothetical protein